MKTKAPTRVPLRIPTRPNHRLRELRRNRGLSPAQLGALAGGISAKTIRDIEDGTTSEPHADTMFRIAEALRVKATDLDAMAERV